MNQVIKMMNVAHVCRNEADAGRKNSKGREAILQHGRSTPGKTKGEVINDMEESWVVARELASVVPD